MGPNCTKPPLCSRAEAGVSPHAWGGAASLPTVPELCAGQTCSVGQTDIVTTDGCTRAPLFCMDFWCCFAPLLWVRQSLLRVSSLETQQKDWAALEKISCALMLPPHPVLSCFHLKTKLGGYLEILWAKEALMLALLHSSVLAHRLGTS